MVAVAGSGQHSLVLKPDGTVVARGCTIGGQTHLLSGLNRVVALAAGGRHEVFLTAESSSGGLRAFETSIDFPQSSPLHFPCGLLRIHTAAR